MLLDALDALGSRTDPLHGTAAEQLIEFAHDRIHRLESELVPHFHRHEARTIMRDLQKDRDVSLVLFDQQRKLFDDIRRDALAVQLQHHGGRQLRRRIGDRNNLVHQQTRRLPLFIDLAFHEHDAFFADGRRIFRGDRGQRLGENHPFNLPVHVFQRDNRPLLTLRTAAFGDLRFHIGQHPADRHFRAFTARHRLLGAGGGVPIDRRLMLRQRMAGDVETEQILLHLQKLGAFQFLHIRQRGAHHAGGTRCRRRGRAGEHVQLPAALVILRLLAHLDGFVDHLQQRGALCIVLAGEGTAFHQRLDRAARHLP